MMRTKNVIIYPRVLFGKKVSIEEFCIIGKPPRGRRAGELPTRIGTNAVIRAHTTIYAGTDIGASLQTGHGVLIREDNHIGENVSIGSNSVLEFGNHIGNGVRIHSNCFLEWVTIEDDVFIGPHVVFTDDPHPMNCPKFHECVGGAKVKRLARIGANVTLLPGVTVGRNSLIGAGSVVVEDVPDDTVVVGNPARPVKRVDQLRCVMGYFERVYDWAPYQETPHGLEG
jgi:acetyltransferase-like isoleucine patch superfamily enzyme